MVYWAILSVIIGLAVGSFLNVVIFRIDDLKSVINTRSKCQHCQKMIAWYDLVPLLSFVLLKGKCRHCKQKISNQYPIVEFSTAVVFLLLTLSFGATLATIFYAIIYSILIVIFVYDIKTQYVLDIFSWSLLVISVLGGVVLFRSSLMSLVWGLVFGGGILGILVVVSKEKWMGLGDVFIGTALGAVLGSPKAILMIFLSFIFGSVYGLFMIYSKKKTIKESLPFTPFIIIASFVALLLGDPIINWYLGTYYLY